MISQKKAFSMVVDESVEDFEDAPRRYRKIGMSRKNTSYANRLALSWESRL